MPDKAAVPESRRNMEGAVLSEYHCRERQLLAALSDNEALRAELAIARDLISTFEKERK